MGVIIERAKNWPYLQPRFSQLLDYVLFPLQIAELFVQLV